MSLSLYFNLQDTTTAVVKKKPKVFSKDWFKEVLQFPCISAEAENLMLGEEDDDFEDEQTKESKKRVHYGYLCLVAIM